jgi:hypothetical protein
MISLITQQDAFHKDEDVGGGDNIKMDLKEIE